MAFLLAYAQTADTSDATLHLILYWIGILAAAALLAFVPVAIASSRRHRQAHLVLLASIVWAVLIAGVSMYALQQQFAWIKEYTLRVDSGYYDPQSSAGAPALPLTAWGILTVAYLGLLIWSAWKSTTRTAPPA